MRRKCTIRRPVPVGEITITRTVAGPGARHGCWRCRVFALRPLGVASGEARVWSRAEMARISEMMRVG